MSVFAWSPEMSLDMPALDTLHTECTDLLAATLNASDDALLAQWDQLITHTASHFAQEDRWMLDTGFTVDNCHSGQHATVLQIMREGAEKSAQGDLAWVRQMAQELTVWLPHHIDAMDASLAQHLSEVGYDTVTGQISKPEMLPGHSVSSCGVEPCGEQA